MKAKIFIIALALVAMTGVVSAQKSDKTPQKTCVENVDGKCNKQGKGERKGPKDGTGKKQGQGKGQGQGQGKCDGSGAGKGNFVDVNKDGVCDNKK